MDVDKSMKIEKQAWREHSFMKNILLRYMYLMFYNVKYF